MYDDKVTSLDYKEKELLKTLTKKYEEFIRPNFLQAHLINTKDKVSEYLPGKVKEVTADAIKSASDWAVIKKVIETAGKGFGVVNENSARYTLSKNQVMKSLNNKDIQDDQLLLRLLESRYHRTDRGGFPFSFFKKLYNDRR